MHLYAAITTYTKRGHNRVKTVFQKCIKNKMQRKSRKKENQITTTQKAYKLVRLKKKTHTHKSEAK